MATFEPPTFASILLPAFILMAADASTFMLAVFASILAVPLSLIFAALAEMRGPALSFIAAVAVRLIDALDLSFMGAVDFISVVLPEKVLKRALLLASMSAFDVMSALTVPESSTRPEEWTTAFDGLPSSAMLSATTAQRAAPTTALPMPTSAAVVSATWMLYGLPMPPKAPLTRPRPPIALATANFSITMPAAPTAAMVPEAFESALRSVPAALAPSL